MSDVWCLADILSSHLGQSEVEYRKVEVRWEAGLAPTVIKATTTKKPREDEALRETYGRHTKSSSSR
eukprot:350775-Chlamydomonas_euryale.AAC.1